MNRYGTVSTYWYRIDYVDLSGAVIDMQPTYISRYLQIVSGVEKNTLVVTGTVWGENGSHCAG